MMTEAELRNKLDGLSIEELLALAIEMEKEDDIQGYIDNYFKEDTTPVVANFKDFLESEGMDVDLFWKNCKKKYQGWTNGEVFTKRKELKTLDPKKWLSYAFDWETAFESDCAWRSINYEWKRVLDLCREHDLDIEFGFEDYKVRL